MKLLYVNPENTSVMEAQVVSLLEYYYEVDKFSTITLIQGCRDQREKTELDNKLSAFKLDTIWFKTWFGYTFFENLAYSSIRKILNKLDLDDQTILHVRGELYGYFILKYLTKIKSKSKLLIDFRGVVIEEIKQYYTHNILLKQNKISLFEKAYSQIKYHSYVTVVSEAFKEYLVEKYGFNTENICVHPNIANEQFIFNPTARQLIRKNLGLNEIDMVAICSSNGGSVWQKDKDLIIPLLGLNAKVINLSSIKQEIPGVINKLVPFNHMPGYLSAVDLAILWRDNNIVNEVASPSKFSEFVATGLSVIHNGSVRIASDFIRDSKTGIIIKSFNDLNKEHLLSLKNVDRINNSIVGRNSFGINKIGNSYIMHYEKMLKNRSF